MVTFLEKRKGKEGLSSVCMTSRGFMNECNFCIKCAKLIQDDLRAGSDQDCFRSLKKVSFGIILCLIHLSWLVPGFCLYLCQIEAQ